MFLPYLYCSAISSPLEVVVTNPVRPKTAAGDGSYGPDSFKTRRLKVQAIEISTILRVTLCSHMAGSFDVVKKFITIAKPRHPLEKYTTHWQTLPEMGQSPNQRMEMQPEDGELSDMSHRHHENDPSKDAPSVDPSASLAETKDETHELVVPYGFSLSGPQDANIAMEDCVRSTTTPVQYDSQLSSSGTLEMDAAKEIGSSIQPVAASTATRRQLHQGSSIESAPASAGTESLADTSMLVGTRNSMFSGNALALRSPSTRRSQVFVPSPLNHAHPAPSFVVDNSVEREFLSSQKNLDSTHPSLSGYSQATLSYSRPIHDHGHSPSPGSQHGSEPSIGKLASVAGSPRSSPPGLQYLPKVVAGPSHSNKQSSTSPPTHNDKDIIHAPNKIATPSGPVRQLPTFSSPSSPASSSKSIRVGAPINLYDQTILQVINSIQTHRTPSPPSSFSPISATIPSPPRARKRAKPHETAVAEDPFEGFNSGSERDDEDDVDFGATSSPSPSVEEMLSPSPTPSDDDKEDSRQGEARRRRKGKGRAEQDESSSSSITPQGKKAGATPNRLQVRAERSGAKTVEVSKKNNAKRRKDGKGDWPVAVMAKGSSSSSSAAAAMRMIENEDQSMGGLDDGVAMTVDAPQQVPGKRKKKAGGTTREDAVDLDDLTETPSSRGDHTTHLLGGKGDGSGVGGGEDDGEMPMRKKKKTTQQIKSSGRHGSGWTLVVEMVRGEKKAVWKLEH
ncbi:MAG: hypothetical protein Q9177_002559 [Variospora cf. flavescens]